MHGAGFVRGGENWLNSIQGFWVYEGLGRDWELATILNKRFTNYYSHLNDVISRTIVNSEYDSILLDVLSEETDWNRLMRKNAQFFQTETELKQSWSWADLKLVVLNLVED